jgi:hypothetical protein
MYTITDVTVVALDCIKVTYSSAVVTWPSFFLASNYLLSTADTQNSMKVSEVLNKNKETSTTEVLLAVKGLEEGYTYTITCLPQTDTLGVLNSQSVTAKFIAQRTKVDSLLSKLPSAYDKSPGSRLRTVITSIAANFDEIGGATKKWEPSYTP